MRPQSILRVFEPVGWPLHERGKECRLPGLVLHDLDGKVVRLDDGRGHEDGELLLASEVEDGLADDVEVLDDRLGVRRVFVGLNVIERHDVRAERPAFLSSNARAESERLDDGPARRKRLPVLADDCREDDLSRGPVALACGPVDGQAALVARLEAVEERDADVRIVLYELLAGEDAEDVVEHGLTAIEVRADGAAVAPVARRNCLSKRPLGEGGLAVSARHEDAVAPGDRGGRLHLAEGLRKVTVWRRVRDDADTVGREPGEVRFLGLATASPVDVRDGFHVSIRDVVADKRALLHAFGRSHGPCSDWLGSFLHEKLRKLLNSVSY